jgi:hypothetical protein
MDKASSTFYFGKRVAFVYKARTEKAGKGHRDGTTSKVHRRCRSSDYTAR